jgi:AraC-like DNA-binding protein
MRRAESAEAFVRDPLGAWTAVGPTVLWCAARDLGGCVAFGRPTAADTRATLACFAAADALAPRFDTLTDVGRVEEILPEAFEAIYAYALERRAWLRERVRVRIAVVPAGMAGFALAGIAPALGGLDDMRLVIDAREGFRTLRPVEGDALCDEVEAMVRVVRATPSVVLRLRDALRAAQGGLEVAAAARQLGTSTRSLQRQLTAAGTSFREEVLEARFRAAAELLAGGAKVAAVAAQLGITETGLSGLFRTRAGVTPGEYRRAARGGGGE